VQVVFRIIICGEQGGRGATPHDFGTEARFPERRVPHSQLHSCKCLVLGISRAIYIKFEVGWTWACTMEGHGLQRYRDETCVVFCTRAKEVMTEIILRTWRAWSFGAVGVRRWGFEHPSDYTESVLGALKMVMLRSSLAGSCRSL
jgi:hypothetical protein